MSAGRRGAGALLVMVGALLVVVLAPAPGASTSADPEPGDRRVLVISVPGLRWDDLAEPELRQLRSLLDDSSIANLSTRIAGARGEAAPAYLTVGAGTRAIAASPVSGMAFGAEDPLSVGTAGEEYARQQGAALPRGGVAVLGWQLLVDANAESDYDATLGALGQALADAGVDRGVVGNADRVDALAGGGTVPGREVAASLADATGAVPCGEVSADLLLADPTAPFGVRADQAAVVGAVRRCATARSVVVVEASDLRRLAVFEERVPARVAGAARTRALADTDALVGALLKGVDHDRDAVVVMAPTTGAGLGVLGIRAPEVAAGFLRSGNTRRDGNVLLSDLAPTIADLAGVDVDEGGMEGRAVSAVRGGDNGGDRRRELVDGEAAALFRDRILNPMVLAYVGAVSALALVAALAFTRGWRRVEPPLEVAALTLLAVPTLTYLAALGPFHDLGAGAYVAFVGLGSLALAAAASLLRRRWLLPLVVVCGSLSGTVAASVVLLGSRLQLSTVFGDSPIVAGRFSGINNVTFAFFVGASVVLACLIVHVVPGRRGRQAMVGFLAAAMIIDVAPMWGADVGGALAGLPALGLIAAGLGRWKVRWQVVALTVLGLALLIGLLGLIDLTRPSDDRSHLGRLFERIGSDGASGLTTVVERKLAVSLRSVTTSPWRFACGPLALAGALVLWQARARLAVLAAAFPALRRAVPGMALLAVLGFALNDSGIAVPGALLGVIAPIVVYLLCRIGPGDEVLA